MSSNLESTDGEIFSSDGLPPLPPLNAPVTSLSSAEKGDDILDQGDNVDLVQAFEVFSGKLFFPSSNPRSLKNPESGTNKATTVVETPLQRLARLRMEVSELEQDFKNSASVGTDEGSNSMQLGSDVLQDLASRLAAITNANSSVSTRSVQSDLTNLVSRELERLQLLRTQKRSDGDTEESGTGVTYELYPAGNDSGSTSVLEERMSHIENMLGVASSASSSTNGTILDRLRNVEQMAKSVDLTSLDAAAARAKLIRTDLEAVAKHRSKLPLPPEDSKTITFLHEQMLSLSGLSNDLPTIVTRLTDLAHLHTHASDFATRLVGIENSVDRKSVV